MPISLPGAVRLRPHLRDGMIDVPQSGGAAPLAAPVNASAPVVTPSSISTGGALTTTNGLWTANPAPTFTYQWQKAGVNIASATASSYTVVAGDVGSAITCNVTATNSQGNATAASNGVTPTAGAFSPTDIAGLQGWWRADAGTSTTTDGVTVSSWADQSGNGRDATQATIGQRPTFKTAIINGKPVLRFDGGDDRLTTAAFSVSQPTTIFVVGAYTSATGFGYYFDSSSTTRHAFGEGVITSGQHAIYAGSTGVTAAQAIPYTMAQWACVFNGASSLIEKNGAAFASGDPGAQALNGVTIGSNLANTNFLPGDIAELLVYSGAVSPANRASMKTYLSTKYGI